MPICAEFEEKEYELPLYLQLAANCNHVWPPGQVFEEYFGIDAALIVNDLSVWRWLGFSQPKKGAVLADFNWGYIWRRRGRKRKLPHFALNFFIQAKRPERMLRRDSIMLANNMGTPCYRFWTVRHQQRVLEILAHKVRHRALITYACPVFCTLDELFDHIEKGTLIYYSSFPRVEKLRSHHAWIFDCAGAKGLACSDPTWIDDSDILTAIRTSVQRVKKLEIEDGARNAARALEILDREIRESIEESEEGNERDRVFFKIVTSIEEETASVNDWWRSAVVSFAAISVFSRLYDVHWSVLR